MSARAAIPALVAVFVVIGFGLFPAVRTPVAIGATAMAPTAGDDEPSYSYVGSKKCKKCHIKQYKSWAETKMANAFDILKPGNNKEAKEKFKLDVEKDYTKDAECLKCHTVGYGKPGGYTTPSAGDKKAAKTAAQFEGVGCESCHGPGSGYIEVFEGIMKSDDKYKVEDLYAVGLWKIGEDVCLTCHNEDSPTINAGDAFDYEKRKEEGTHEHFPLKKRGG